MASSGEHPAGATAPPVDVVLLGAPRILAPQGPIQLPDRALAIVTLLAASPRRRLRRSELRAVVYGELDAGRAAVNLRQTLARLRRLQSEQGVALVEEDGDEVGLAVVIGTTGQAFAEGKSRRDKAEAYQTYVADYFARVMKVAAMRPDRVERLMPPKTFDEWYVENS